MILFRLRFPTITSIQIGLIQMSPFVSHYNISYIPYIIVYFYVWFKVFDPIMVGLVFFALCAGLLYGRDHDKRCNVKLSISNLGLNRNNLDVGKTSDRSNSAIGLLCWLRLMVQDRIQNFPGIEGSFVTSLIFIQHKFGFFSVIYKLNSNNC